MRKLPSLLAGPANSPPSTPSGDFVERLGSTVPDTPSHPTFRFPNLLSSNTRRRKTFPTKKKYPESGTRKRAQKNLEERGGKNPGHRASSRDAEKPSLRLTGRIKRCSAMPKKKIRSQTIHSGERSPNWLPNHLKTTNYTDHGNGVRTGGIPPAAHEPEHTVERSQGRL